jgi:di/tricarboxylate transporter
MSVAQVATLLCLLGLVPGIIASTLAGVEVDIGVTLLALGALVALLDPTVGTRAFARIDWSTAFVVGGIVTYVGVLQKLDAVNLLGRQAMTIGTPMLAALVICMIAALVSAFASTTGVLAALVPMAVPLASAGAVPGWALITTLGVSATIVDCSPFSNTGATLVASAPENERPRLRVMLLRWSLAMVVVGPLVLLPLLVAFGR